MADLSPKPDLNACLMEIATNAGLRLDLQQVLGDYCHQSRNRLNSLKLSLYLANRLSLGSPTSTWSTLEQKYADLEVQIDRIQAICRPMELSLLTIDLNLLFEDRRVLWSQIMQDHGQTLDVERPDSPNLARFDVNRLGSALDSLITWRAEQGDPGAVVSLNWWSNQSVAQVTWAEPKRSAGILAEEIARSLPSWAMPILSRVIREHGGTLRVDPDPGWQLTIQWPVNLA